MTDETALPGYVSDTDAHREEAPTGLITCPACGDILNAADRCGTCEQREALAAEGPLSRYRREQGEIIYATNERTVSDDTRRTTRGSETPRHGCGIGEGVLAALFG